MSYYLAASLVQLRNEVNQAFPRRDKSSDGWIGDASHSARKSDHNPDYSAGGVVRAIDIDIDGRNPNRNLRAEVLKAAIGDPRVWYVISNRIIYSRTYNWAARRYTGSNPHTKHVHISIRSTKAAETNRATWLTTRKARVKPGPVNLKNVREQFLAAVNNKPRKSLYGVKRIQRALNDLYGLQLEVDGYVGEATLNGWGKHERAGKVSGRPRVPDLASLRDLAKKAKVVTRVDRSRK